MSDEHKIKFLKAMSFLVVNLFFSIFFVYRLCIKEIIIHEFLHIFIISVSIVLTFIFSQIINVWIKEGVPE